MKKKRKRKREKKENETKKLSGEEMLTIDMVKKRKEKMSAGKKWGIVIILTIFLCIGVIVGYTAGYENGTHDMATYMLSVFEKVTINGNITVGINETKLDQAIADMKNITINLINKTMNERVDKQLIPNG
jgi:hypothetical protein